MVFNQLSWQEVHVTALHRINWHICLILRPSDPLQTEIWHSFLSPHGKQVDWPLEATSHPENTHTWHTAQTAASKVRTVHRVL